MEIGLSPSLQMVIDIKVTQNVVMDLDITNGRHRAIVDIWLHLDEPATTVDHKGLLLYLTKLDQTWTSQLKLERT